MICDNLKNWPPKHKSTRHTLHNFSAGLFVPPHKTHGLFVFSLKNISKFLQNQAGYFFFFHVKETEKPSTSQPDRLTLSHSDPPLFLLPYYFNTEKKQSLPSTPLHNFLKGTLLSPTQNPRVPIDEKIDCLEILRCLLR
jgi:hypothetical protein